MRYAEQVAQDAWEDECAAIIARDEYDYYGWRVMTNAERDDEAPIVGGTAAPSYVWDDGEWTDEELPGTSAMNAKQYAVPGCYMGRFVVLLGSYRMQHGEDQGEIVMIDAVVLAVHDRGRYC